LVTKEIREIEDALATFKAAVAAGEMPEFQNGAIRSHGGTLRNQPLIYSRISVVNTLRRM
jgi:hypothetical protein